MSSTTEGRDDWAREDDLDLGQDEDEQLPAKVSNGVGVNGDSVPSENLNNGSIARVEEDLPDVAPQDHVQDQDYGPGKAGVVPRDAVPSSSSPSPSPLVSPRPAPKTMRSSEAVDDIVSNPDDTPSLRVGTQRRSEVG